MPGIISLVIMRCRAPS